MKNLLTTCLLVALLGCYDLLLAQQNETPNASFTWKKGKTNFLDGHVVLKSGRRMEGMIGLVGAPGNLETIMYEGDGKEIEFPAGAIQSYGVKDGAPGTVASNSEYSGVATYGSARKSTSPDDYYTWTETGSEGGNITYSSEFESGYVELVSGGKLEGEISVRKLGDRVRRVIIKTADGKERPKIEEVLRYGLNKTAHENQQDQIARQVGTAYSGTVYTDNGKFKGLLDPVKEEEYNGYSKLIFKDEGGNYKEFNTTTAYSFELEQGVDISTYIVKEGFFVHQAFDGKSFSFYVNPKPTNLNQRAMNMASMVASTATSAIATGIVNKDAKDNNYETNMDSVIQVSTTEQLVELRQKMLSLYGYNSYDEAIDNSQNESYKNNLSALEIAIQGRQASENMQPIYYFEWVLENKNSGEKTILYSGNFKEASEVLLYGCYQYLDLDKRAQNDLKKWKNRDSTIEYLDNCYSE